MPDISFSAEPALWVALIDTLLVLGVSFGLPLTPEQKAAIDALLAAVAGVVIRSRVTPVVTATVVAPAAPVPPAA